MTTDRRGQPSPTTLHEYDRLLDKQILPRFGQTKVRSIWAADLALSIRTSSAGDAGRLGHANAATTLNAYGQFAESSAESAAQVLGIFLDGPNRDAKARFSTNRR
jgi:hypothetical protein